MHLPELFHLATVVFHLITVLFPFLHPISIELIFPVHLMGNIRAILLEHKWGDLCRRTSELSTNLGPGFQFTNEMPFAFRSDKQCIFNWSMQAETSLYGGNLLVTEFIIWGCTVLQPIINYAEWLHLFVNLLLKLVSVLMTLTTWLNSVSLRGRGGCLLTSCWLSFLQSNVLQLVFYMSKFSSIEI